MCKRILLYIILIWIILFIIDHNRIKQYHNCNIDCFIYSPINILYSLISTIPLISVYDNISHQYIPDLDIIKNNWTIIRNEYYNISNKLKSIKGETFFEDDIIKTDKWERFYIKWYSDISNEVALQLPQTTKLLNQCPNIQLAMFSVMKPGTIVYPHRGPYRGSLRVHLGLECPSIQEGCYIKIDDKKYGWKDGELLIFDDTYTHEVQNKSQKDRVIMFMDISRPVILPFIQQLTHLLAKSSTRTN